LHISSSPPPAELSDDNSAKLGADETTVESDDPITIEDTVSRVIVFGRRSCGLTTRMMRGLDSNNVPYLFQNVDSQDGEAHLNQRMEQTGNRRNRYMLPVIYMNGELMYSPEVVTVVMKYQNN
jgi:glutaredoxin